MCYPASLLDFQEALNLLPDLTRVFCGDIALPKEGPLHLFTDGSCVFQLNLSDVWPVGVFVRPIFKPGISIPLHRDQFGALFRQFCVVSTLLAFLPINLHWAVNNFSGFGLIVNWVLIFWKTSNQASSSIIPCCKTMISNLGWALCTKKLFVVVC